MKKLVSMVVAMMMVVCFALPAVAEGALKIGFIGPLTGGAAVYGTSAKQGGELAVEEINALGGPQIEFLTEDDEHDAEKSVNAYNNLMDKGAQLIVGCVTTTPCVAVSAVAYDERVFMLTPSASSPSVTADKDNMFQLCFSDPSQGSASAEYIAEHKLATKVAVIYNNADAYSTGIYQSFEAKAKELGLEIVSVTTFTDDTTDFSVQVADAKDKGAELVFLPIYYTEASQILTTANKTGYEPIFFGCDGMDGILDVEGFDTSLAEGLMLLTPFAADAQDEKTQAFVSAYVAAYGETPNQFAADAYDVIYSMYQAVLETGVTGDMDASEICEQLKTGYTSMTFDGLTGTGMTWDASGAVSKDPKAVVIKDGAYAAM